MSLKITIKMLDKIILQNKIIKILIFALSIIQKIIKSKRVFSAKRIQIRLSHFLISLRKI